MQNNYTKFATEFLPEKIEYLLVGECPQVNSIKRQTRYFYPDRDGRGTHRLWSNISNALFGKKLFPRKGDNKDFFEKLTKKQIYYIDSVCEPINYAKNTRERKNIIFTNYPRLKNIIKNLPLKQNAKILLLHKNVIDAIGYRIRQDFDDHIIHDIGYPSARTDQKFHYIDQKFCNKIKMVFGSGKGAISSIEGEEPKLKHRNAFIALCDLATKENWCWNIGCTTCGCMYFRYAFVELVEGKHPDEKTWLTCKKNHNKLDRFLEPVSFQNKWPIDAQQALLETVTQADIFELNRAVTFPDWLGHIGLVLLLCSDAEHKTRLLTESFIPQFLKMMEPSSFESSSLNQIYLDKNRSIDWRDLEVVEIGLQRKSQKLEIRQFRERRLFDAE